jgi:hypothetical protein
MTDIIAIKFTSINITRKRRSTQKAGGFRLQFVMIQQEVSTHKINVHTIIQVIFVPLTFIAGV